MLHRVSPFRFVPVLLLALAVPFCCCDIRSLLGECRPCNAGASANARAVALHVDHDGGQGQAVHCHAQAPQGHDHDGSAPGKAPENDPQDCSCAKNTGKMTTGEKVKFERPAPAVVAILDWFVMQGRLPLDPFRGRAAEQRTVERPPTSLLRMHCALIV